MPLDVDSEKLLDWIGLSKKLKMTNENIVKNLQVMLTNTKFETSAGIQKRGESIQTTVQACPEASVYLSETPAQPEAEQVTAEQQFGSLSDIQFTILKTMSEATKSYNLKAFASQVNLDSNQIIQQVQELTKKGFLQKAGNGYGITEKGKAFISARARDKSENPDKEEKEKTATNEKKEEKEDLFIFPSEVS